MTNAWHPFSALLLCVNFHYQSSMKSHPCLAFYSALIVMWYYKKKIEEKIRMFHWTRRDEYVLKTRDIHILVYIKLKWIKAKLLLFFLKLCLQSSNNTHLCKLIRLINKRVCVCVSVRCYIYWGHHVLHIDNTLFLLAFETSLSKVF